ncbi:MAG: hypothetical protein NSGCLCUN01_01680 [uncultured Clostridium sp.]
MKNLVIFYSLEDNTRLIESAIVKAINVDIVELKQKRNIVINELIE